jgi:hypothetical protein
MFAATYSFSKDFISQTVCVVDEKAEKKKQAAADKAEWLTPKGFVYPKPKTHKDLIAIPGRPSEARIEDLKEPYRDVIEQRMLEQKGTGGALSAEELNENVRFTELERGYSTRFKSDPYFGALKPVGFDREFQLKLVGDRHKLPRGLPTVGTRFDKDPDAFKSVHLVGDAQRKIVEEAQAKEKEEWESKVVVDHIDFKMCGFKIRDKPLQMNRTEDILHGEPKKEALQFLRTRESHKKKDYGLKPAPLSIMNDGEYIQNQSALALLRKADPNKFITAKIDMSAGSSSGTGPPPQDFVRYIHKDANSSRIMSVLAKTKIPAMNDNEKVGARWEAASAI